MHQPKLSLAVVCPVRETSVSQTISGPLDTTHLCWRILIAVHFVQRLLRGIDHKWRRIIAKKALAHIDNGLYGRSSRSFIHDTPENMVSKAARRIIATGAILTRHLVFGQQLALRA